MNRRRFVTTSTGIVAGLAGPGCWAFESRASRKRVFDFVEYKGTDNPVRNFAGIVAHCDLMVTGDTLAMHIAIGMKVPVLVILGSTCAQEIELYGRGAKIVSDFECSPCYRSVCPKEVSCMEATPAGLVFDAARELLGR